MARTRSNTSPPSPYWVSRLISRVLAACEIDAMSFMLTYARERRAHPGAIMSETAAMEPVGKREKTKVANRQAILAAARRVFAQLGYEAATVRDIIRGTELASGTFYNYFRSKEEVFEALADDGARRFRPILRSAHENA